MPLRRWMTEHHLPGWYSWLVVVGTSLASVALSIVVTLNATARSVERERQARVAAFQEQVESQQQSKRAACLVITSQDDAFNAGPAPATPAGKRAAAAWANLRIQFRCDKE